MKYLLYGANRNKAADGSGIGDYREGGDVIDILIGGTGNDSVSRGDGNDYISSGASLNGNLRSRPTDSWSQPAGQQKPRGRRLLHGYAHECIVAPRQIHLNNARETASWS